MAKLRGEVRLNLSRLYCGRNIRDVQRCLLYDGF